MSVVQWYFVCLFVGGGIQCKAGSCICTQQGTEVYGGFISIQDLLPISRINLPQSTQQRRLVTGSMKCYGRGNLLLDQHYKLKPLWFYGKSWLIAQDKEHWKKYRKYQSKIKVNISQKSKWNRLFWYPRGVWHCSCDHHSSLVDQPCTNCLFFIKYAWTLKFDFFLSNEIVETQINFAQMKFDWFTDCCQK